MSIKKVTDALRWKLAKESQQERDGDYNVGSVTDGDFSNADRKINRMTHTELLAALVSVEQS